MNHEPQRLTGRLYGIGLGPGDPELVTLKASRCLERLEHVFAPKAEEGGTSIARRIAEHHVGPRTTFHELVYPMVRNPDILTHYWRKAALPVLELLNAGKDVGFITLGDPMLYSTFTYLNRAIRAELSSVETEVIAGVTSFCASAALTQFTLGEKSSKMLVAPAPSSQLELFELTRSCDKLVLMKVGSKLPELVTWLRAIGLLQRACIVSRAGLPEQRILTDLGSSTELETLGYLSTLLVDCHGELRS
jgi:precorrin-2/cobalt-factor-2 C20-methyltransferase